LPLFIIKQELSRLARLSLPLTTFGRESGKFSCSVRSVWPIGLSSALRHRPYLSRNLPSRSVLESEIGRISFHVNRCARAPFMQSRQPKWFGDLRVFMCPSGNSGIKSTRFVRLKMCVSALMCFDTM